MDPGGAPERVLQAHFSDQTAHLFADPRSAPGRMGLPSPVSGKTHAMPTHDGLGPDDGYGVKDVRTTAIKPDEQRRGQPNANAIDVACAAVEDLMLQYQDFSFEPPSRLEAVTQDADEKGNIAIIDRDHVLIRSMGATPADGVFGSDRCCRAHVSASTD